METHASEPDLRPKQETYTHPVLNFKVPFLSRLLAFPAAVWILKDLSPLHNYSPPQHTPQPLNGSYYSSFPHLSRLHYKTPR